MDQEKTVHFSIVKQKIIKTDEVLRMYVDVSGKLKKAQQAYRGMKLQYDQMVTNGSRIRLEHERCTFKIENLKQRNDKLDKENSELREQKSLLEEQYNQQTVQSQLNIKHLQEELQILRDISFTAENCSPKKKRTAFKTLEKKIENGVNHSNKSNSQVESIGHLASNKTANEIISEEHVTTLNCSGTEDMYNKKDFDFTKKNNFTTTLNIGTQTHKSEIERKSVHIQTAESIKTLQLRDNVLSENKQLKQRILECEAEIMKLQRTEKTKKSCSTQTEEIEVENKFVENILKEMLAPCILSPMSPNPNENLNLVDAISPIPTNIKKLTLPEIAVVPPTSLTRSPIAVDVKNYPLPEIVIIPPTPLEKSIEVDFAIGEQKECDKNAESVTDDNSLGKMAGLNNKRCKGNSRYSRRYKYRLPVISNDFVNFINLRKKCLRRLSKKRYILNKEIRKIRKLQKQDHLLKILRTLKQLNINFTISNDSISSKFYNNKKEEDFSYRGSDYIERNVPTTIKKSETYLTEPLNCTCKKCSQSCMLLTKVCGETHSLGFYSIKNEVLTPTSSRMENKWDTISFDTLKQINSLNYSSSTPENVLETLAEIVSRKLKEKENNILKTKGMRSDQYDTFDSETETEIERLFNTSDSDVLKRNKMLLDTAKKQSNYDKYVQSFHNTNVVKSFLPLEDSLHLNNDECIANVESCNYELPLCPQLLSPIKSLKNMNINKRKHLNNSLCEIEDALCQNLDKVNGMLDNNVQNKPSNSNYSIPLFNSENNRRMSHKRENKENGMLNNNIQDKPITSNFSVQLFNSEDNGKMLHKRENEENGMLNNNIQDKPITSNFSVQMFNSEDNGKMLHTRENEENNKHNIFLEQDKLQNCTLSTIKISNHNSGYTYENKNRNLSLECNPNKSLTDEGQKINKSDIEETAGRSNDIFDKNISQMNPPSINGVKEHENIMPLRDYNVYNANEEDSSKSIPNCPKSPASDNINIQIKPPILIPLQKFATLEEEKHYKENQEIHTFSSSIASVPNISVTSAPRNIRRSKRNSQKNEYLNGDNSLNKTISEDSKVVKHLPLDSDQHPLSYNNNLLEDICQNNTNSINVQEAANVHVDEREGETVTTTRRRKCISKLQSKVLRQVRAKRQMLRTSAECHILKINHKKPTIRESVQNKKNDNKIHIVQNILIPANSSHAVDLLKESRHDSSIENCDIQLNNEQSPSKNNTVVVNCSNKKKIDTNICNIPSKKKRVEHTKVECDLLSKIINEMDKDRPEINVKEKKPVIDSKETVPDSTDEKQWRKGVLVIAESIHNISSKPVELREHINKNKIFNPNSKLNAKRKILLSRLLKLSSEEQIPEEIILEFKRIDVDSTAEMILQRVSQDIWDKPDVKYYPAPLMTRTQRILLGLMVRLEQENMEKVMDTFVSKTEAFLFKIGCGIRALLPVVRLYMAVCKLRRDIDKMRNFCCDAFLFMGDLAVPLFFIVLTSWTEVLPMESDVKNYPLAKILIQIVHLKNFKKPGYNLLPLKFLFSQFYGYPKERWNCDEIFEEFFQQYLRNPDKSSDLAIRLLCKNKDTNWVYKKVNEFFKPLIYKIPAENVNFKATSIILIGNICRNFKPINQFDESSLNDLRRWLIGLTEDENVHNLIIKSVDLSLSKLPKRKTKRKKTKTMNKKLRNKSNKQVNKRKKTASAKNKNTM